MSWGRARSRGNPSKKQAERRPPLSPTPEDVPFALLYLLGSDNRANLATAVGWGDGPSTPPPPPFEACGYGGRSRRVLHVTELSDRFERLPAGRWNRAPRAPSQTLVGAGQARAYGYLVLGVSPNRALDERYMRLISARGRPGRSAPPARPAPSRKNGDAPRPWRSWIGQTAFFSNISHDLGHH